MNMVNTTYFQTIEFSAGTYLALPAETEQVTPAVLSGVGIVRTTLLAFNLDEKLALIIILYSILDLPISVTTGWTLKGRLMLSDVRYLTETRECIIREFGCLCLVVVVGHNYS